MIDGIRRLVRPMIAVGLLVIVGYLVYVKAIGAKDILAYFGIVVGFYFGERAALKVPKGFVEGPGLSKPPPPEDSAKLPGT